MEDSFEGVVAQQSQPFWLWELLAVLVGETKLTVPGGMQVIVDEVAIRIGMCGLSSL